MRCLTQYELLKNFRPRQLMLFGKLIEGGVDVVVKHKVVLLLVGSVHSRLLRAPASLDLLHVELFFAG